MYLLQEALDKAVLFRLFIHAQTSDKHLNKEEVAELFDITISSKRAELALDNLWGEEFISRTQGRRTYSIEAKGYREVEKNLSLPDSFYRQYADAGDEWLANQTIALAGVPAADRVVSRSDNQAAFAEIEAALDQIGDELSKSNEVSNILGDEKAVLVGEIEASKSLTRSDKFRLSRLLSLLVPALKFLADKFAGGAIGEAAKHLMNLIFNLT